jgi:hypothetical protein
LVAEHSTSVPPHEVLPAGHDPTGHPRGLAVVAVVVVVVVVVVGSGGVVVVDVVVVGSWVVVVVGALVVVVVVVVGALVVVVVEVDGFRQRPSRSTTSPGQHGLGLFLSWSCAFCPSFAQWAGLSSAAARAGPLSARIPEADATRRLTTCRRETLEANILVNSSNRRSSTTLSLLVRAG